MRTSRPPGPAIAPTPWSARSRISSPGTEMWTSRSISSAMALAAPPIIWFIASVTADDCSSSSASAAAPWPPIIRSATMAASGTLRTRMQLPSSPSV